MAEAPPLTRPSRLRGRERELAALRQRLRMVAAGEGGVVLVTGMAGTGTTSILNAAGVLAEGAGVTVYRGAGDPQTRMVPLGPLVDALLSGDTPVLDAQAWRTLQTLAEPGFWFLQELQERLERAALAAPLLVMVDDVQWADTATLLALRTLPRRLSTHAILWVLGLRAAPGSASVEGFIHLGAEVLSPAALDDEAVALVAEDVLGAVPDAALLKLVAHERARPFLLVELLRGLHDDAMLHIEDGCARLIDGRAPKRFCETIAEQLERLSPAARSTVQLASVLGFRVPVGQLAQLLDGSTVGLLSPVREALDGGFFVEADGALTFRHHLIREAVDASLPASMRRALRRQVLALVLEHEGPATEVAALLLDVAEPGDHGALKALRRAAAELAGSGPPMAALLARRALELTPGDDPDRSVVVAETLPLLFAAGQSDEARVLADEALLGVSDPAIEARIRLSLAQVCVHHDYAEGVRQCQAACALRDLPEALGLQARLALSRAHMMDGGFAYAEAVAVENLRAARGAEDPAAEVAALNACSTVSFHRHRYQEALDWADEAWGAAARRGRRGQKLWPVGWTTWLHGVVGRPDEALRRSEDELRAAQADGAILAIRFWLMCRTRILLTLGRLADARAEAEGLLEMDRGAGPGGAVLNVASFTLGCVAVHTGDRQARQVAAGNAATLRADESLNLRRTGDWLAALLADAEGDPAGAMAIMRETVAALGDLGPTLSTPQDPLEILVLLRIALRAGDRENAEQIVSEIERRAALNRGFPVRTVSAIHARGLLEADAAAMQASVRQLGCLHGPLAQAGVLEDAAGVLADLDREAAIAHLRAAHARFIEAGADADAARVRERLSTLGVRSPRSSKATPATGWESLTPSELAVVELVAGGGTNRAVAEQLFLSPHTVSSHLRHAFTKLGIRSRVELARVYTEHVVERGVACCA